MDFQHVTTKQGSGPAIKGGDVIQLNYILKTKDGKLIESTYEHKQPVRMQVGMQGVPNFFYSAIYGMKVGERRTATIPPSFGLNSSKIPKGSTLIFNLELVKIGQ